MIVTGWAFALTINALLARFVRDVRIIANAVAKRQTITPKPHNRLQAPQRHSRYYRSDNHDRTQQRQPWLGYDGD
jgi:hypothetical protein